MTPDQDAIASVAYWASAGLRPREVWLALGLTNDLPDITWGDVVDAVSAQAWAMTDRLTLPGTRLVRARGRAA